MKRLRMKRLVVNADDFGMSHGINRGILEAHRRGIVTSTTLLANGAAFEDAVASAAVAPKLGVGVHLNLTDGRPLLEAAAVPSLVNSRGEFWRDPAALLRRHLRGQLRSADVERELWAQIDKVRASGIPITHLDGHKHVHMLPGIVEIVARLAKESGIPAVRFAAERGPKLWRLIRKNRRSAATIVLQNLRSRVFRQIAKGARTRLQDVGICFPNDFYGITQTGFLRYEQIADVLQTLRPGTSELMCHPGYTDDELPSKLTRLHAEREDELEALTRPEISRLIAQLDIHLINYRELTRG